MNIHGFSFFFMTLSTTHCATFCTLAATTMRCYNLFVVMRTNLRATSDPKFDFSWKGHSTFTVN